jgi:hypothetical protein
MYVFCLNRNSLKKAFYTVVLGKSSEYVYQISVDGILRSYQGSEHIVIRGQVT